ncbi:MAG: hypothetical protein JWO81_1603 [Alphaproteobacteria bacterium]|nr:hypothetical protein [Alphaproteobacteria bacterium]
MIIFDLKCAPLGHVFEAWFGSTADYEAQQGRGLVSCPLCGSPDVAKAPMAPAVGAKGNAGAPSGPEIFSGDPAKVKAMLAAAAAVQKKMLEGSEAVGDRFADEARAIHLGEAEARAIHGRATREQAEGLADDGIPVAPLPFPVADPGTEN